MYNVFSKQSEMINSIFDLQYKKWDPWAMNDSSGVAFCSHCQIYYFVHVLTGFIIVGMWNLWVKAMMQQYLWESTIETVHKLLGANTVLRAKCIDMFRLSFFNKLFPNYIYCQRNLLCNGECVCVF